MVSAAYVIAVVLTAASGACLSLQSGTNATLGRYAGKAFAAVLSFSLGLVCCGIYAAVDIVALHGQVPTLAGLSAAPWWAFIGGPLGATYVIAVIIFAPTLGAGTIVAVAVTAQLLTAVVLDLTGAVGFPRRALSWPRLVGAALLVGGVMLVCVWPGEVMTSEDTAPQPPSAPSQRRLLRRLRSSEARSNSVQDGAAWTSDGGTGHPSSREMSMSDTHARGRRPVGAGGGEGGEGSVMCVTHSDADSSISVSR